jgi:hypothetical protein
MKFKALNDLELFELIVAAYPDKFDENADGCIWDEVLEFAENLQGFVDLTELLGRVVMLTHPMVSPISGGVSHVLGKVLISSGSISMTAAVKRGVKRSEDEARQESEAQAEGRIDCHVIEAQCDHYSYQCDSNGEVAISHCTHPDNPSDYEGNCTHAKCPKTDEQS